jgi:hypothetical protein
MNAKRVGAAEVVLFRAMPTRRTAAGLAMALESAALLHDEDIAAELVELRKLPEQLREALAGAAAADELYRTWQQRAETAEARVAELEAAAKTSRTEAIADVGDWLDENGQKDAAYLVYTVDIPAARDMRTVEIRPADEAPITYSLTPEALHASSGAVIETPARPEDVTRQVSDLRGLLARQRAAVEEPHDDPVGLHHDYRVPHDLPPAVTS